LGTVLGVSILRTSARGAATPLFGIARPVAQATNDVLARKLASRTAFLVGIITNSALGKFAGRRVAARIAATASLSAAITVFPFFYYSVATLTARYCDHISVV
jgi:hypothetical protein